MRTHNSRAGCGALRTRPAARSPLARCRRGCRAAAARREHPGGAGLLPHHRGIPVPWRWGCLAAKPCVQKWRCLHPLGVYFPRASSIPGAAAGWVEWGCWVCGVGSWEGHHRSLHWGPPRAREPLLSPCLGSWKTGCRNGVCCLETIIRRPPFLLPPGPGSVPARP